MTVTDFETILRPLVHVANWLDVANMLAPQAVPAIAQLPLPWGDAFDGANAELLQFDFEEWQAAHPQGGLQGEDDDDWLFADEVPTFSDTNEDSDEEFEWFWDDQTPPRPTDALRMLDIPLRNREILKRERDEEGLSDE